MASEMRRAAQALMQPHPHVFKSGYPPAEASARLNALAGNLDRTTIEAGVDRVVIRTAKGEHFVGSWKVADGGPVLDGLFLPPPGAQRIVKGFGIAVTLLIVASAWAFLAGLETSLKVSAGLSTVFAILAFPYVIVGLSSQRSGREAAMARAVQRALEAPIL